jgi:hypothetical protein
MIAQLASLEKAICGAIAAKKQMMDHRYTGTAILIESTV